MANHAVRPEMAVMLTNHPNTRPEPALAPIYASDVKRDTNVTATYGTPFRSVLINILGAFPTAANPSVIETRLRCAQNKSGVYLQRTRDATYMSLGAAEADDAMRHALINLIE